MPKYEELDKAYKSWRERQTPDSMAAALEAADPVINNAITSYAGGNKTLRTQAKKLAARGIQTYDPERGAQLHSHLMNQLQPLRRLHQQRSNVIHVPERVQVDLFKLRQAQQGFFDRFGREAADTELAEHLGLPQSRIRHLRKFMKQERAESSMQSISDEGEEPFYPGSSSAKPEDIWTEYVHHDASPIDQKILEWKTGFNGKEILSTQDIARKLRISPSAVSQRATRMAQQLKRLQEEGA
jgi:DNA-directed RNA polymerase specialized sigma subunit